MKSVDFGRVWNLDFIKNKLKLGYIWIFILLFVLSINTVAATTVITDSQITVNRILSTNLTSSGFLGVRTNNPLTPLDVNGTATITTLCLYGDTCITSWAAVNGSGGSITDTNATTECTNDEVLLGNGTCFNITGFFDDTDTAYNVTYDTNWQDVQLNASSWSSIYNATYESTYNATYDAKQDDIGSNCAAGNYTYGVQNDGTLLCREDTTGGGGSSKWIDLGGLALSPNATFAPNIELSGYINATYVNATDWSNVTITEGQISGLSHTTDTDTNASTECSNDTVLLGNTTCFNITGFFDGTGNTYNTTYHITWQDVQLNTSNWSSIYNATYESTYNATYDAKQNDIGSNCDVGNYTYGVQDDGTLLCRVDTSYNATYDANIDTNASTECTDDEVLLGNTTCFNITGFFDDTTIADTNWDTNASTECANDSVLLGNTTCFNITGFFDDTDTNYNVTYHTTWQDVQLNASDWNSTYNATYESTYNATYDAKTDTNASTECTDDEVLLGNTTCFNITGFFDDTTIADTNWDTNATTECTNDEALLGNGSCINTTSFFDDTTIADTNWDTNASTECANDSVLLGNTTCFNVTSFFDDTTIADTNWDTNATTECTDDEVLLGNGSCANSTSFFDDTTIADTNWDTNATTECTNDEVLLGNGSCANSTSFFDDTDTNYNVTYHTTWRDVQLNTSSWASTYNATYNANTDTDTNASTECTSDEVLLGNGSCANSTSFFDNVDTNYNLTYHTTWRDVQLNATDWNSTYNATYDTYIDTNWDTNATTECTNDEVLLGNGSCANSTSFFDDTTIADTNWDTNATTECTNDEVLLGNGSCSNSTSFFDDTDTNYNVTYHTTWRDVQLNTSSWASIYNATYESTYNATYHSNIDTTDSWGWTNNSANVSLVDSSDNVNAGTLYVDNSGSKVGIGTANPSVLLEVSSTDPRIRLTDEDGGDAAATSFIEFYDNGNNRQGYIGDEDGSTANIGIYAGIGGVNIYTSDGNDVKMQVGGTGRNVGIGIAAPAAKLHVVGGDVILNGSGSPGFFFDESEVFVGIGTMNPSTTLDVNGNVSITGNITVIQGSMNATRGIYVDYATYPACSSTYEGMIVYNTTANQFLGCNSTDWSVLG